MALSIDPKEFAKMTVIANPSDKDTAQEKAKDALELYLTAFKLAEKYERHSTAHNSQETTEIYKLIKDTDINL